MFGFYHNDTVASTLWADQAFPPLQKKKKITVFYTFSLTIEIISFLLSNQRVWGQESNLLTFLHLEDTI